MWRSVLIVVAASLFLSSCSQPQTAQQDSSGLSRVTLQGSPSLDRAVELIGKLQYEQAAEDLISLIKQMEKSGNPRAVAEATFWLGYCREKQGKTSEAMTLYRTVLEKYPQAESARFAQDKLDELSAVRSAR